MSKPNISTEEKLRLLGKRLRAGAANIRPVPKQVLENVLKPDQTLDGEKERRRERRRDGPSR